MTNFQQLIGTFATIRNCRGAEYKGVVKAILANDNIIMDVHAIRLTGRGTDGRWQWMKKVETNTIKCPCTIIDKETTNEE